MDNFGLSTQNLKNNCVSISKKFLDSFNQRNKVVS